MAKSAKSAHLPPVVDLFAGAGGLSSGFAQAGFPVPFSTDNWETSCATHRLNHPDSEALCADISAMTDADLRAAFGDARVVVGGPPCQGFSTSGKQLLDDPRNRLVGEYVRAIRVLEPDAFVMENVEGLAKFGGGQLVEELRETFIGMGYSVDSRVVAASSYGVPQKRRRFVLLGSAKGEARLPEPTHSADTEDQLAPLRTFSDATSDLPLIGSGEESSKYRGAARNDFQHLMRENSAKLTLHKAASHREHMVKLMAYIPQGKSAFDVSDQIPKDLMPTSGFPNSYARFKPDEPAPTMTRNFTTPSSANCIHPHVDRALTLREGARIQTFPDDYEFAGNFGDIRLQIGNAVPPMLAAAVAGSVRSALGI